MNGTSYPVADVFQCEGRYCNHTSKIEKTEHFILEPLHAGLTKEDFNRVMLSTWLVVDVENVKDDGKNTIALYQSEAFRKALNLDSDRSLAVGLCAREFCALELPENEISKGGQMLMSQSVNQDIVGCMRVFGSTATINTRYYGECQMVDDKCLLVIGAILDDMLPSRKVRKMLEGIAKCLTSSAVTTYMRESYLQFALVDFPRRCLWNNARFTTKRNFIEISEDVRPKRRDSTPAGWHPQRSELLIRSISQVRVGMRLVIQYPDQPYHWQNGNVVFVSGPAVLTKTNSKTVVPFEQVRIPVWYLNPYQTRPRTVKIINLRIIGPM